MADVSFGAAIGGKAETYQGPEDAPARVVAKLEKLLAKEFGDKRPKWAEKALTLCREHPILVNDKRILIVTIRALKNMANDQQSRIDKIGL